MAAAQSPWAWPHLFHSQFPQKLSRTPGNTAVLMHYQWLHVGHHLTHQPRLASQNDDNHDFQKCTHSSLHRKIPLSCCCSVTRGGCGLASCGLAWGKTKRSAVLIWMGISSKRSFKISLFLPLLILLYNLDIICAKKVLLTCNDCIAAGCGTLNPTQKNKNKNISISISMI